MLGGSAFEDQASEEAVNFYKQQRRANNLRRLRREDQDAIDIILNEPVFIPIDLNLVQSIDDSVAHRRQAKPSKVAVNFPPTRPQEPNASKVTSTSYLQDRKSVNAKRKSVLELLPNPTSVDDNQKIIEALLKNERLNIKDLLMVSKLDSLEALVAFIFKGGKGEQSQRLNALVKKAKNRKQSKD